MYKGRFYRWGGGSQGWGYTGGGLKCRAGNTMYKRVAILVAVEVNAILGHN